VLNRYSLIIWACLFLVIFGNFSTSTNLFLVGIQIGTLILQIKETFYEKN